MDQIVVPGSTVPSVEVLRGDVADDEHAIRIFLDSYGRRSAHTVRSYEKECRRFLLWLFATRDPRPALLPDVTVSDINNYLAFLSNPRPFAEHFLKAHGWEHQPFRGPLATESVKHCITVLHKMFDALRNLRASANQPYCLFNPVVLAHGGIAGTSQEDEIEEALTPEEWAAVQAAVENLPRESIRDVKHYHRSRWLTQLLYRTWLRRSEASRLKMGSFEPSADGWNIRLTGKGAKKAKIVATTKLMAELKIYRTSLGLPPLPSPGESRPAVLAVTGRDKGITDQAIYLLCKVIFQKAADLIEGDNPQGAQRLRLATPHWMRHTGVTHALEAGAHMRYVQAQARHSNLSVTARYDHKERKAWRMDLERSE
jgi:site-specific recombinase XerD